MAATFHFSPTELLDLPLEDLLFWLHRVNDLQKKT